jgi:hypothetical protein
MSELRVWRVVHVGCRQYDLWLLIVSCESRVASYEFGAVCVQHVDVFLAYPGHASKFLAGDAASSSGTREPAVRAAAAAAR